MGNSYEHIFIHISGLESLDDNLPHISLKFQGTKRLNETPAQRRPALLGDFLLVGGLEHVLFFHILGIIIPTD